MPSASEAYEAGAGVGELTNPKSATDASTGIPVPDSGSGFAKSGDATDGSHTPLVSSTLKLSANHK